MGGWRWGVGGEGLEGEEGVLGRKRLGGGLGKLV